MSLAWGGYSNGSAALQSALVQAEGGIPGDMLEVNTARAWAGWRAAIAARTGVWLQLDHSDAIPPAFRNIPFQQSAYDRYKRQGSPIASPPGQSNHGWARAIDVTGFENRADVWKAMNDLAPQFGLSNATGKASGERWHWESMNPPATAAAAGLDAVELIIIKKEDEDDMPKATYYAPTKDSTSKAILAGQHSGPRGVNMAGVYASDNLGNPLHELSRREWEAISALGDANGRIVGLTGDELEVIAAANGLIGSSIYAPK